MIPQANFGTRIDSPKKSLDGRQNVEAYGGLFQRIAGSLADLRDYALAKGQRWFCGRSGRSRLFPEEAGAKCS